MKILHIVHAESTGSAMSAVRKGGTKRVDNDKQDNGQQAPVPIVWTHCTKCGDTWTLQTMLVPGKCRVCGGKPKLQEVVF